MIEITDLSYVYAPALPNDSPLVALDKISLHIPAGKCIAITGANNCGKTTLCLAVGLGLSFTVGKLTGTVHIDGHDIRTVKPGLLSSLIGMVFQSPTGQLFNATIEDEIAWGLENKALPPVEIEQRIDEVLAMVRLDHLPRDRVPHTLSGGEQKRLVLAAVLALRPKFLILDEPSAGLSPQARTDMINVLKHLRKTQGVTILLAENDSEVMAALADEVVILDKGKRVAHEWPRNDANFSVIARRNATRQSTLAIEFKNLSFSYNSLKNEGYIFKNINLKIPQGEFVALLGDNGAGKTTLSRLLIGLLRPQQGAICIMEENTEQKTIGQLAKKIGLVFQDPELQIFCSTVYEEIAFGPRNIGMTEEAVIGSVKSTLELFDLVDLSDYPPAVLSFSERRRVALASIAAMNTPILVLDEPTAGLDAYEKNRVMQWLIQRHQSGTTIILITHDMELVNTYAERVLILEQGQIL